jgi:hypothetical protein
VNRTWVVCVGAVGLLLGPTIVTTSASAAPVPSARVGANVCRHTSYTGDGGYFSQGSFYWEPNDTATITVDWCSAGGVIVSKKVAFSTTIPSSEQPRLTENDDVTRGGASLKVNVGGDYESRVINNIGFILLAGHVSANGHRHFADLSAAGG